MNIKKFFYNNKRIILIIFLLLLGICLRTLLIDRLPKGFNQDEASSGYEAYSLLKYGIDRNGKSYPVHFISWGSGQNILYSLLIIPFIKVFDLNIFTTRIPMAILGSLSLIVWFYIMKKENKNLAILGLFILVINPWHIMKSRWGLESNIFPDIILLSILFLIKTKNKKWHFYIYSLLLGISAYSYGTSYFFLPILYIIINIYLLKNNYIKWKDIFISIIIIGIITLPLICFIFINQFDYSEFKIFNITIPRLNYNRYQEISSIFSKNFFHDSLNNFVKAIKLLITQNDGCSWNMLPFYGINYVISLPLTIWGIINSFKDKHYINKIFNIWFISSLLLLFVVDANINRCNIIIFPIIYYNTYGLYKISNKYIRYSIIFIYIILFISFINCYVKSDAPFQENLDEPILYVKSINSDIYMSDRIFEPYIFTLFYTKYNTFNYVNEVNYFSKNVPFEDIAEFGKYHFYLPNDFSKENIYILNSLDEIPFNNYEYKKFKNYYVVKVK